MAFACVFVGLLSGCRAAHPAQGPDTAAPDDSAKRTSEALADGDSALRREAGRAAFQSFTRADRIQPGSVDAKRWAETGDLLGVDDDVSNRDALAMNAYARAVKADPKFPGPRYGSARLLLRNRAPDLKEALDLLDEEEALGDADPKVLALRKHVKERLDASRADEKRRDEEHDRGARALAAEDAERSRSRQERLEAMHAQTIEAGSILCQLEGYRNFGKEFGNEMSPSVAAGSFVGVLVQCINRGKASLYFPSGQVAIVDSSGRRFAIDTSSSFDLAVWKSGRDIQNPETLQLHPGSPRFVQLMFDLPDDVATAGSTRLAIGGKTMALSEAMQGDTGP
jgi:hypothetical protein